MVTPTDAATVDRPVVNDDKRPPEDEKYDAGKKSRKRRNRRNRQRQRSEQQPDESKNRYSPSSDGPMDVTALDNLLTALE